ncbi:ferrous iron transport protein A [Actinocrinis puniceicyclus]|uniref:Ferrous iron transport protein A n=1 Tax=Actinocrinis puniceicyclus TaxID=977794 RepID=A0A8J8BE70_9ACTN|nr:hypothetical protein [Actinocrinis puniceicyclus]MBS2964911.1 ferrous iron transport protein A [Actinocrinis puniceicyclus]
MGSRVVLRYRLDPSEHGAFGESLSDLVGELLEWTGGAGGHATVRRRSGEQVSVPLARVVAAKVIPSPPRSRPARSGPPVT